MKAKYVLIFASSIGAVAFLIGFFHKRDLPRQTRTPNYSVSDHSIPVMVRKWKPNIKIA
jgi:hypothetical protein